MTNPNSEKTVADQEKVERQSASDLTEGSLVKRLGQLALPFLIPNLLHLVVLVADRVWVGDVGTEAMAGLGVAHAALMICVTLLMGPAIGTLAGVARSIGAGDDEEARRLFGQGLLIGLCVGAFSQCLPGMPRHGSWISWRARLRTQPLWRTLVLT